MKTETIITISREEIIDIIQRKYNKKFKNCKLSSQGFKGVE